ncbi:MAG: LamG domain-containing protein, partial [Planctomycetes bacterium]|nr:LamG domain-containing protein [Planctomycetota bacterium]
MLRKWTCLVSVVFVIGLVLPNLAHAVPPTPVAWWKLDGDALDSSGNDRNGTLHGNPRWVPGVYGDALEFDGDDYVTIDGYKGILGTQAFTITAWIKATGNGEIIGWGSSGDGNRAEFRVNSGRLRYESGGGNVQADTTVTDNKWHHAAVTIPANAQYVDVTIYLDGEDDTQPENDTDVVHPLSGNDVIMGQRYNRNGRWYTGAIDDLRIYDVVLTQEEIREVMAGIGPISLSASEPGPENESTDVTRDAVLSWKPGEYAPAVNGHKLYFSENFNDVNDGIGGITQDANSYAPPQLLDFGKTYYWRVDEVNAPPDSTIFEGEVWQFTVEPFTYPIAGDNIIATASSTGQEGMGPENTINGSGLDANDLHSTEATDMWLSSDEPNAWIEYELDKVHKLHQMWVWNSNQAMESILGLGYKDVSIEYSVNGTDYTTLDTTHEFARAPGADGYEHNTTVD